MTKKKDKTYIINHRDTKYEVLDIEMKLGDIWTDYDDYKWHELNHYLIRRNNDYNWNELKKSIEEEGLKTLPIISYHTEKTFKPNFKYTIVDGNHRIRTLKEIHGLKFKITLPVVQHVLDVRLRFPERRVTLTLEEYLKIETIVEISGKRQKELMRKTRIKKDEGNEG